MGRMLQYGEVGTDITIEVVTYQYCTIRWEAGVCPKTFKNRDVFAERTWMYSPRVLGETPGYRRIPNEVRPPSGSVLSDRRDTGTCSPRHAREYVPVGLCKNIPVFEGLRKQVPISRLRVRGFIQFYQQKSLDWVFNPFARAPKSCRRLAIR
jgi:hypothetical protein